MAVKRVCVGGVDYFVVIIQASSLSFTSTLSLDGGVECFDGVKLSQFTLHEVLDGVAVFHLRLPCRDVYRLIIYTRHSHLDLVSYCSSSCIASIVIPPPTLVAGGIIFYP